MSISRLMQLAAAGSEIIDPDFSDVRMLLHGDGTNGSTTIIDSSNDSRTITVSGNAALSTAEKKFGTASIYLDGSTSTYVSTPHNPGGGVPNMQFGTGDFTVEGWHYLLARSNDFPTIFATGNFTSGTIIFFAGHNSSTTTQYQLAVGNTFPFINAGSIAYNQWVHFAVVRDSGTITLYIDGTSVGSATGTENLIGGTNFVIGASTFTVGSEELYGYIDDFRVTKGVARYTGNFTPPDRAFPDQ